ncbi:MULTISPECIES: hypothetical protein [unclassified Clostridium]
MRRKREIVKWTSYRDNNLFGVEIFSTPFMDFYLIFKATLTSM